MQQKSHSSMNRSGAMKADNSSATSMRTGLDLFVKSMANDKLFRMPLGTPPFHTCTANNTDVR